jgi:hypothetical protein
MRDDVRVTSETAIVVVVVVLVPRAVQAHLGIRRRTRPGR